jgi:hypothetical protein
MGTLPSHVTPLFTTLVLLLVILFTLVMLAAGFAAGLAFARRRVRDARVANASEPPASSAPPEALVVAAPLVEPSAPSASSASTASALATSMVPCEPSAATIRFEPVAARGTRSIELDDHSPEWRAAMRAVGDRFASSGIDAVVFVHGTFAGSDPLSAYRAVERALPTFGRELARSLRKKTHGYVQRVLGDVGNFGGGYVRLFEEAIRPEGERIPCTNFVWSSENHHVGRLEGALGLLRTLATHAELGNGARSRLLVIGHSHAGQLFALVTQLLARSIATEAILDIARARSLDVAALEADLDMLDTRAIDFVTFGAPARYAWATVDGVRALHVIGIAPEGTKASLSGDWVRRLGVEGSDFPPLDGEDRRINATLARSLGAGFAPSKLAAAVRSGMSLPAHGEIAFVDYAHQGLTSVVSSGLGHGSYTRLDAMLFHARLVADRLYVPETTEKSPS